MSDHPQSYEEWYDRKVEIEEEIRESNRQDPAAEREAREEAEAKAREAYEGWVLNKENRERAIAAVWRLNTSRASDDAAWRRVARAMATVDIALDIPCPEKMPPMGPVQAARPEQRTLFADFVRWSREHHAFDDAVFPKKMSDRLTRGFRNQLDEDRETGQLRMGGLRYQEPPEIDPGQVPRPLTLDDKIRNALFHRLCLRAWKEERREAEGAVGAQEEEERRKAADDAEKRRERAAAEGRAAGGGGADASDPEGELDEEAARTRALHTLGVGQLIRWAGEDARAAKKRERADKHDKHAEAEITHKRWVERKARTAVRLPPEGHPAADPLGSGGVSRRERLAHPGRPQRFDFSFKQKSQRRPPPAPRATAVDSALRNRLPGQKYVHTGRWQAPPEGEEDQSDLGRSRRALLERGFVHRENFKDPEEGDIDEAGIERYEEEKESNPVIQAQRRERTQGKKEKLLGYARWRGRTGSRQLAMKLLACVPRGTAPSMVDQVLPALMHKASGGSLRRGRDEGAAAAAPSAADLEDAALRAVGAVTDGKVKGAVTLDVGAVERLSGGMTAADLAARAGVGAGEGKEADSGSEEDEDWEEDEEEDDPLFSGGAAGGRPSRDGRRRQKSPGGGKGRRAEGGEGSGDDSYSDDAEDDDDDKYSSDGGSGGGSDSEDQNEDDEERQRRRTTRVLRAMGVDEDAEAEARKLADYAEVKAETVGRLLWLAVGQSLKRIDGTLQVPFTRWARPVASGSDCEKAWGRMERGGGGGAGMLAAGAAGGASEGIGGRGIVTPEQEEAVAFLKAVSSPGRRSLRLAVRAVVARPPAAPLLRRVSRLEPAPLPLALAVGRGWARGPPLLPWAEGLGEGSRRSTLRETGDIGLLPSYGASLHLAWGLPEGSPPESFYVLESCGASGSSQQRRADWRAVVTDPPSASGWGGKPGSDSPAGRGLPAGGAVLRGLPPGKEFHFRLRALNADGASPYHAIVAVTCPPPPPRPVAAKVTAKTVRLEWGPHVLESVVADALRGIWIREATSYAAAVAELRGSTAGGGYAMLEDAEDREDGSSTGSGNVPAAPMLPGLPVSSGRAGDGFVLGRSSVPAGRLLAAMKADRHLHADCAALAAAQSGVPGGVLAAAAAEEGLSMGDGCTFVPVARRRVPVVNWSDLPWSAPAKSLAAAGGDSREEVALRARRGFLRRAGSGLAGIGAWLEQVADDAGDEGQGGGGKARSRGSGGAGADGGRKEEGSDRSDDDEDEEGGEFGGGAEQASAVSWGQFASHAAFMLGLPVEVLSTGTGQGTVMAAGPSAMAASGRGSEALGHSTSLAVVSAARAADEEAKRGGSSTRRGGDRHPSVGAAPAGWSLSQSSQSTPRGRPQSARPLSGRGALSRGQAPIRPTATQISARRSVDAAPSRPGSARGGGQSMALVLASPRSSLPSARGHAMTAGAVAIERASGTIRGTAAGAGSSLPTGFRYVLEQCVTDPPPNVGSSRSKKGRHGGQKAKRMWKTVYEGRNSFREVGGLREGCAYAFRVSVIGGDGGTVRPIQSRPSPVCTVTTRLPRPPVPVVPSGGGASSGERHAVAGDPTELLIALPAASSAVQSDTAAVRRVARGSSGEQGTAGNAAGGSAAQVLRGAEGGGASATPDDEVRALIGTWTGGLPAPEAEGPTGGEVEGGDAGPGVDLARVWAAEDVSGEGVLPLSALPAILRHLGSPAWCSQWQLQAAGAALDPLGSGSVSFARFRAWIRGEALVTPRMWRQAREETEAGAGRLVDRPGAGRAAGGAAAAARLACFSAPAGLPVPGPEAPAVWELIVQETGGEAATVSGGAQRGASDAGATAVDGDLAIAFQTLRSTVAAASGLDADAIAGAEGGIAGGTMVASNLHGGFGGLGDTASHTRGTTMATKGAPGASDSPPVVVYRGQGHRSGGGARTIRLTGLRPNARYAVRLRRVGRATASAVGPALSVSTPPMPPLAPAVCEAFPQGAVLRWHPGEGGASRYVVEGAIVEALPRGAAAETEEGAAGMRALGGAAGATAAGRAGVVTSAAVPSWQLAWTELAQVGVPCATVGGLSPSAVYRVRVRAVGAGGATSAPSPEAALVTPEPSAWRFPGPQRAADEFVVDARADAVLGDAILFTESVPVSMGRVRPSGEQEFAPIARRKWLKARETLAALEQVAADTGGKLSQEEQAKASRAGAVVSAASGVAERTVAARVVSVSWPGAERAAQLARRLKEQRGPGAAESGLGGEEAAVRDAGEVVRLMGRERVVKLQVVWSRAIGSDGSVSGGQSVRVEKGAIIERKGWELDSSGTHRLPWLDEGGRWAAAEEAARLLRDWAGVSLE